MENMAREQLYVRPHAMSRQVCYVTKYKLFTLLSLFCFVDSRPGSPENAGIYKQTFFTDSVSGLVGSSMAPYICLDIDSISARKAT